MLEPPWAGCNTGISVGADATVASFSNAEHACTGAKCLDDAKLWLACPRKSTGFLRGDLTEGGIQQRPQLKDDRSFPDGSEV